MSSYVIFTLPNQLVGIYVKKIFKKISVKNIFTIYDLLIN